MSHFLKRLLFIAAVCGGLFLPPAIGPALADIMIMPIRVTFGSRDRMQDIIVINNSNTKPATYRLSWINTRQNENGDYIRLDGPLNPELDPEKAIMFSPQQVTLGPNGKQRIRMALRRPADLPEGEYRSHLQLKSLTRNRNIQVEQEDGVNIGMGMQVGVAIPVIIRHGMYEASASIGKPSFVAADPQANKPPMIEFYITKTGNFSTNGRLAVYWKPPGGEEQVVSRLNGFNIFHEAPGRHVSMPLKVGSIVGGTIRIVFEGDGPDEGKSFDEKTFPIGG